jgi:hypothetical protein
MTKTVKTAPAKPASTKDSGRVHVGGGMMRFASTKAVTQTRDAGKVHVGGGMMRF